MNLPLPEADAATAAEVRDWLDRFAACVREVDYAAARPFWHADIVIFGTYQELVKSLSAWTERQWNNVWPRTADFRFDLANTMVMASPDGAMAVAIAPWTSTGFQRWNALRPFGPRHDRGCEATGRALVGHPFAHAWPRRTTG